MPRTSRHSYTSTKHNGISSLTTGQFIIQTVIDIDVYIGQIGRHTRRRHNPIFPLLDNRSSSPILQSPVRTPDNSPTYSNRSNKNGN